MVPILLRRVSMWRRAAQAVAVVCALVLFLLSLDDDPVVLPPTRR